MEVALLSIMDALASHLAVMDAVIRIKNINYIVMFHN
jgi:hypothetical protein